MHAQPPVLRPVPCGVRCIYAAYLGFGALGLALTALACGAGDGTLVVRALGALAVAALLRARLASTGQLAACADEDDTPTLSHPTVAPELRRQRAALLARCAKLERLRGTPGFDPWTLLELRRQLAALDT